MNNLFSLEISNTNSVLGLLEGDEVIVSAIEQPKGNGKDLAVFELSGEHFVSTFTRLGNQILLLGEKIQVVREHQIKIVGKVVGGSHWSIEKAPAVTGA